MSTIIPAILTNDLQDFTQKLGLIESFPKVSEVHIDFADNLFVPNLTLLPGALPSLPLRYQFTAHLMTFDIQSFLTDLQRVGFEAVSFHCEAAKDLEEVKTIIKAIKTAGLKPQLAINPGTQVSKIRAILPELSTIHVMTVDPGFQGSPYIPGEEKIKSLRSHNFYGTIIVDGGINAKNAKSLLAAGADKLVVGSAIFKSRNPLEAYSELLKKAI